MVASLIPQKYIGGWEARYHRTGRTGTMLDRYAIDAEGNPLFTQRAKYAAGTPAYASDINTFVPSHEATGGLIVDFARSPDSFPVNKYIKMFPVEQMVGYYARFGRDGGLPEEAARVLDTSLANFAWADNNDAPDGSSFDELFQYVDFRCIRYAYPWRVPYQQGQQASWDIRAQRARMAAHLAMTARTQLAITLLTTSGNYPTGHSSAVASITGNTGKWDVSTVARQDIRRSVHTAAEQIRLDTLGVVGMDKLVLVMSPGSAHKVARSQEIVDYLKSQEGSKDVIEGKAFGSMYDMPRYLYGVEVVIEDAVKATNAKAATRSVSNILGDTTAFITARPGSLEGVDAQSPNFSTASLFVWDQEEMLIEQQDNTWQKRTDGRVVDTLVAAMTAPATGYLFTSTTG